MIPLVTRRIGTPVVGALAAGLFLVIPLNPWVELSGAWEQPFAAVFLLALLLMFMDLSDFGFTNAGRNVCAGVLIGCASLLSPALIPAVVLMILSEIPPSLREPRKWLPGLLTMLVVALLLITPWTVRNYRVLGGFIPIRSNLGLELWIGNNPDANGRTFDGTDVGNSTISRLHPHLAAGQRRELVQKGELKYMQDRATMANDWIRENPGRFLTLTLHRFRLFWFPPLDMGVGDMPFLETRLTVANLLALGAFIGLTRLVVSGHRYRLLLLAALIGPSLVYMVTHVDLRYRYPVHGLCVLLSADFCCALIRRLSRSGSSAAETQPQHSAAF
jgi:hypothetical protein